MDGVLGRFRDRMTVAGEKFERAVRRESDQHGIDGIRAGAGH